MNFLKIDLIERLYTWKNEGTQFILEQLIGGVATHDVIQILLMSQVLHFSKFVLEKKKKVKILFLSIHT